MTRKVYAGGAAMFNEHRNTSRTFPVPPNALPEALAALKAYRRDPHSAWLVARAAGEHLHGSRRADGSPACCPVPGCLE